MMVTPELADKIKYENRLTAHFPNGIGLWGERKPPFDIELGEGYKEKPVHCDRCGKLRNPEALEDGWSELLCICRKPYKITNKVSFPVREYIDTIRPEKLRTNENWTAEDERELQRLGKMARVPAPVFMTPEEEEKHTPHWHVDGKGNKFDVMLEGSFVKQPKNVFMTPEELSCLRRKYMMWGAIILAVASWVMMWILR